MHLAQCADGVPRRIASQLIVAEGNQNAVGVAGQYRRIRDNQDGGAVDYDQIAMRLELAEQVLHPMRAEQFRRIRRQWARGHHAQFWNCRHLKRGFYIARITDKYTGHTDIVHQTKDTVYGWLAQISIDQDHTLSSLCKPSCS